MVKPFIFSSFLLFFSFFLSFAVAQDLPEQESHKKNAIFLELGGGGPVYSLNYDRIFFCKKKIALSFRVGYSILAHSASLPLGMNVLIGEKNHHFRFSVGVTPYVEEYQSWFKELNYSDKKVYFVQGFGYRYQKPAGGLFFTIGVNPIILLDPPEIHVLDVKPVFYLSGNLALGVCF